MSTDNADKFLGAWSVTELVYGPDAGFQGTILQQRHLHRIAGSGLLRVSQHCQPSPELNNRAMGGFAGHFVFNLEKRDRDRLRVYLGPDVLGSATAFGEGYLCGQGVWPGFGYNFRSWSISLSDQLQLTGGEFFRGAETVALIVGAGRLDGMFAPDARFEDRFTVKSGQGTASVWAITDQEEQTHIVHRDLLAPDHWVEWGSGHEDHFRLEARGSDFILSKNNQDVGMAKRYGPLLTWDIYGVDSKATRGIDISDPFGSRQFSIRQNFLGGRLVSFEGLRFHS